MFYPPFGTNTLLLSIFFLVLFLLLLRMPPQCRTFLSKGCEKGHLHYLHFWWKLVKPSMEASVKDMEASTTSTEASIASMEAFMDDMEAYMEAWNLPWKRP